MSKEIEQKLRSILRQPNLTTVINSLDLFYSDINDKGFFLDYFEFDFLSQRRNKIKSDDETLGGVLKFAVIEQNEKTEQLERWVKEQRSKLTDTNKLFTEPKVKLKELALEFVYRGKIVNKQNADKVAQKFGFTSGNKLYQYFSFFSSKVNRTAKPNAETKKTLLNKIDLFETVITRLPIADKQRAINELEILKSIYKSEYE